MPPYFFYISFVLWAIHALRRVLFCLYFWQVKEYRFDRVKGDIKQSLMVLFPKLDAVMIVLLFLLKWEYLILFTFCTLGGYSAFLFYKKAWKKPRFTNKAVVLFATTIIVLAFFALFFINNFLLLIIIAEVAIPLATFLIVQAFQLPTFLIKNKIYNTAREKILAHKDLTVIGITGSYGKSSTKEFLYALLSSKYKVLKTTGNINTEIGVAKTVIDQLGADHQIFIVEMGAYKKGEIKLLCDIVKPKMGIVTGVNEQHFALFETFENLLSAEGGGELAESLSKKGVLFVNGDNKYCLDLYKKFTGNKKIYSLNNKIVNPNIWAEDIEVSENNVSFIVLTKDKEMAHVQANVLGKHSVQNLLGAILIAKELGMSLEEISEACRNIVPQLGGMVLKNGKNGIKIIDSSYSANPNGVLADLDYLSIFKNKKIIVMPCLIELGEKSSEIHEKIGKKIGQVCDLAIITTEDKFKEIETGFKMTGKGEGKILLCDNSKDIYSVSAPFCKPGDAVLLEGRVPSELIKFLT